MKPAERMTEVQIFGERYTLRSDDDPDYLQSVAEYVDDRFREVAKGSPALVPGKVAVLASLNIADELFKRSQEVRRVEQEALARIDDIFQLLQRGVAAK